MKPIQNRAMDLFTPLPLTRGKALPHRIALAPLTNGQSHPDGSLSEEEYRWLLMRAQGGFALTMTCAAHVQAAGQGFAGQLGIFSDHHLPGLSRLAQGIRKHDSRAVVQLHHAGMRSPRNLTGTRPMCPSAHEKYDTRAMTLDEIERVIEDFVLAAQRAEQAGFDGVELHGAHGYLLGQFLSSTINQREDEFGGSLENRARLIRHIIAGIRQRCNAEFQLGLRLSPERFGVELGEMQQLCGELMASEDLDYLDLSLWDVFKNPQGQEHGPGLFSYFADLPRHGTALGVAGKVRTPAQARQCLDMGADFIFLGRAAIVDHDFPQRLREDPNYQPTPMPASPEHLSAQGVSPSFLDYLRQFDGVVQGDP